MGFEGFPAAALDFYDDLEVDNTKTFWTEHKQVYEDAVKGPMTALMTALEPEFGESKVFRPYRDVRFAKDKTPYKTNQGAYIACGPSTGWYVEVAAPGVRVGAGIYDAASDRLGRIRDAIAEDRRGKQIERILAKLEKAGWEIGGEKLKTTPRGYDGDHPRIELLRHKSIVANKSYGFEPVIHTPALLDKIRTDWRACKPLIDWITDNA